MKYGQVVGVGLIKVKIQDATYHINLERNELPTEYMVLSFYGIKVHSSYLNSTISL